jgi:tRNA1Val (adenine37-N6)-methyltransferase
MSNSYFSFKQFTVKQDKAAFKVGTDGVILGAISDITGTQRILDIGTGSGLIALMLAQRCDAEIVAIEPDNGSFEQAYDNAKESLWGDRIKVLNTSLQDYLPTEEKFDLIVVNPPFFSDSLKNPDPRLSAARHNDNLKSEDILTGAGRLLNTNGKLQLILPYVEGNIFIAEAAGHGFYCINIVKIKPLRTSEIRRVVLTFSREKLKPSESFLTIERGPRHEFTDEYLNLTKDFYLKF